ncbi:D-alanine--D-alanine ligase [Flavobacterium salilacus subsp. salilacus]|nr:D-alanine--D-alanine ligase [Flavobacterium salilacus subsp. salilacus]MBE1615713.1 D-alanine--D-alanine ligase [Flavobacterium sp. SaA2.13]
MRSFIYKATHWEYWPYQIIYIPIAFQWLYYSLRSGSLFFFNASNPSFKNGGFFMESKKEIYNLIPQKHYPKTILIKENTAIHIVQKEIKQNQFSYPIIAKPDIGLRGNAVKKIHNEQELEKYIQKSNFDYLIQEFIPLKNEIGIFYVRFPNQENGKITGIVKKEFLTITGDGNSTIIKLLNQNPRYKLQIKALTAELGNKLFEIPEKGKILNLVPYGNHARGAKFIDADSMKTEKLEIVINNICKQISGFHYGRIDLMYNTIQELEEGKNYSIIEVNGAASEPTHIYDPKHSIFFAWKEIARHIHYMYKISLQNKKKGTSYLDFKDGVLQLKLQLQQNNKITNF